jgi:hypothetical protein
MKLLFASRKLRVLRHGPPWFALSPDKSLLPGFFSGSLGNVFSQSRLPDALRDLLCSAAQFRSIATPTPPSIQFP